MKKSSPPPETISPPSTLDQLWKSIDAQCKGAMKADVFMREYYEENIFRFAGNAPKALAHFITSKFKLKGYMQTKMSTLFAEVLQDPTVGRTIVTDILAVCERDAACTLSLHGLLYSKGLHALLAYRVSHQLIDSKPDTALYIHYLSCLRFSVDIHPRARISPGLFLDHGDSIVIGETTVIKEDVSILQDVTLGGTGKDQGDRHPKIGKGVLIGAGAKILGNIKIGDYCKVGASSVVLKDVPAYSTAVGVPCRIIARKPSDAMPSKAMDHYFE